MANEGMSNFLPQYYNNALANIRTRGRQITIGGTTIISLIPYVDMVNYGYQGSANS